MGRRGRKPQLEIEDEYWHLVLAGVGTAEACRPVGIGRKTGYLWRAERGGLPPLRLAEPAHTVGSCHGWSVSGSPRCTPTGMAFEKSLDDWAGHHRPVAPARRRSSATPDRGPQDRKATWLACRLQQSCRTPGFPPGISTAPALVAQWIERRFPNSIPPRCVTWG